MGEIGYGEFLSNKLVTAQPSGFTAIDLNEMLFPFQRDIVRWGAKRGKACFFEDCGLGKGPQQLEWARLVAEETNRPVLGFAPLAVSQQFIREGGKFGIPVQRVESADQLQRGINITNYERFDAFRDASGIGGLFIDESSCLKGFDGKFRRAITDFASRIPYRVAASATPAPNDFMELGNHAEFLGVMKLHEMLATFFVHDGGDTSKWRLKGHAEDKFWKWVASWAVCIRKPSDLGYSDEGYALPKLHRHQHTIQVEDYGGFLFPVEKQTLQERNQARRGSIDNRVAKAAELANSDANQWLVWCNLNDESAALTKSISGAVEVKGSDKPDYKERCLMDFADGKIRVLVSKPSIAGYGMNFQGCSHMAFVGLSDSFEDLYQATRRCWRFGQKNEVHVHVVVAETEGAVVQNIARKEHQYEEMFAGMVDHMREICKANVSGLVRESDGYETTQEMRLPSWL